MSHDRGCPCGRERYEYSDCDRADCWNRPASAAESKPDHTVVTPDQASRLRRLRLWHWLECVSFRNSERSLAHQLNEGELPREQWLLDTVRVYQQNANLHLRFVQELNAFFPDPADTAERDASLENPFEDNPFLESLS